MKCAHCNTENPEGAKFCQSCGASLTSPAQGPKETTGLQSNVAGLLCYVLGWITGLIFILIEREDQFVRFHAVQSIITFGALSIIVLAVSWIPILGAALGAIAGLLGFVLWILLMIKAYQGERYKLPWVGGIAERQVR